jgi:hypothetical protein
MSHETATATGTKDKAGTYDLYGQFLEVCTCEVLCPCFIGEEPDGGTCEGVIAWRVDRGEVNAVDVSGLTIAVLAHIPGNVLHGNLKVVVLVDDKASPEQQDALMSAFTGQLGGPIADVAALIGEVASIERVPVEAQVENGRGILKLGDLAYADMEPYQGATGKATALAETMFSSIPGSPAYVSKARSYTRNAEQFGMKNVDLQGHNAIHTEFHYQV